MTFRTLSVGFGAIVLKYSLKTHNLLDRLLPHPQSGAHRRRIGGRQIVIRLDLAIEVEDLYASHAPLIFVCHNGRGLCLGGRETTPQGIRRHHRTVLLTTARASASTASDRFTLCAAGWIFFVFARV